VAQVPDHVNDMLRRIFASAEFAPRFDRRAGSKTHRLHHVEKSAAMPIAFDIVRYETATAIACVYLARQLVPAASEALDFDDYAWSADGNLLLSSPTPNAYGGRIRAATTGARPEDRRAAKARRTERPRLRSCTPSSRQPAIAWPT